MPLPDNEKINIDFVIAVEEYPILYDYNLKEYSNRNHQEKVWRAIATKFGATESECKLRWRNIRSAFSRYLRSKNTTGSAAKKPYYLWDHLQYLLPFSKSKPQSGNIGGSSGSLTPLLDHHYSSTVLDLQENQEFDDPSYGDLAEDTETSNVTVDPPASRGRAECPPAQVPDPVKLSTPSSSLSAWRSSKNISKKIDPLEKAVAGYLDSKSKRQDNDPVASADLNFLTSLLPEVTGLPPKKKRVFKRKVLELLEELAEDELIPPPPPLTTSASDTTPSDDEGKGLIIYV